MFIKDSCVSYQLLFFPEIWGNMFKSTYKYKVLCVFVKSSYFRRFWKWCSRKFRSILTETFMQLKFEKKLYTHQLILVTLIPILVKKSASGRRESAPQLHDWEKIWVILKPQNFHGSKNFLEMILPLHIPFEVLYWSPYRFSHTNEGNRVNFAMAANGAPGFISTLSVPTYVINKLFTQNRLGRMSTSCQS